MTPLGDTGLEYDDRGQGEPLVLIHAGVFSLMVSVHWPPARL